MDSDRIKEIHQTTAYPESRSVNQALLQVWNECQQENNKEIEIYKNKIKVLQNSIIRCWKLKIIANHILQFFRIKYRYVFCFEGTSDDSKLIKIEFKKYNSECHIAMPK